MTVMVSYNDVMAIEEKSFSLDELCQLAGVQKRTVRYYIQKGLVERPIGERRTARYTAKHLEQLLTIQKWQDAGLSLERIGQLLTGEDVDEVPPPRRLPGSVEVWSHLVITDGLELHIEPARAGLTADTSRKFLREVSALYERIKRENIDE